MGSESKLDIWEIPIGILSQKSQSSVETSKNIETFKIDDNVRNI